MRPSKYDKHVVVVCLIIFLYSFFVLYCEPVYESDVVYPNKPVWVMDDGRDELIGVEWSSAVIIAPLFCIVFFLTQVFWRELLPVDRHYVKDIFHFYWSKYKK